MSRTKALISILIVFILIALSGVSVWAAPGGQEPAAEPTEEPTAEPTEEPLAAHPVASALAQYFSSLILGLDHDVITDYHEGGMGFGVIAKACWMSLALEGDASLASTILEAKKTGDFSAITLPDGTTPKNWGQFKKAVLSSDKAKKNLGAIMSRRAAGEQEQEDEEGVGSSTELPGKGKGGKPDTPPGQLKNKKDKDEGGGPPAEPPGQLKNKDKGGSKEK